MKNTNKKAEEENEKERLETLYAYEVLDTEEEEALNDLTKLASYICQTPIALISLVDSNKQWFKANYGLNTKETDRNISFCQHTIKEDKLFEVRDTQVDVRFDKNPLVEGYPNIRYYLGSPLISPNGYRIGSLCVIDTVPRELSEDQKSALKILSKEVMTQFELRRKVKEEKLKTKILQKAELQCHNIMENSQGLVCTHDMEGRLLSVNPAAALSLQSGVNELIGKSLYDIIDPSVKPLFKKYLEDIKQRKIVSGIMQVVTKRGERRYWNYRNIRMDELEKESYVIGFSQDITDNILFEKELKKAKEKAELATKIKDQFLANMSHEIRTPINAVIGFSKILLTNPNHQKRKKFIEAINTSSSSLLAIINDILDMSKIEEGKMTFEEAKLDLKQILFSVKTIVQEKTKEKKLKLTTKIDKNIPLHLIGDQIKLSQILLNLIGNAVKFTERGAINIDVSLLEKENQKITLQFKIKDTGIGISKENQEVIFERFRQENNDTTRKYGGAGLGLSITKKLIELQGGQISVESEPNKGSTFSFSLSFKYDALGQKSVRNKTQKLPKQKTAKAILLVEDNNLNQLLASTLLGERGFSVEIATNGKEAIDWMRKKSFDIVLMDIQMPIMDGYKTAAYIREKLEAPLNATPIIALTAHISGTEREKCLGIGMNDYVSKPFDPDELCEKIDYLIKNREVNSIAIRKTERPASKNKHIDLSYLKKASLGKKAFIKEMITVFLNETPKLIKEAQKQSKKGNWNEIQKIMHILKTSFSAMGASKMTALVLSVDKKTRNPKSKNEVPELLEKLSVGFLEVSKELNGVVKSVK